MRSLVLGFAALGLFAIAAAGEQADAPGERWAVIIGINDYQDLGKLTTPRNDAKALRQVLVESGGFAENRVILLTDDAADPQNRPTLATMRKRIENTAAMTEPADTLLIFFSGHGVTRKDETSGLERGYLVPMDGDVKNAVSLDWVKDVLSKARAKSKVLILDACHAGSAAKGVGGIAPSLLKEAGGLVMLLSSAADQVSYPDEESGQSVFTEFLVEGLGGAADVDGDKTISVQEISAYVTRRMKDWYVQSGRIQTPVALPEKLPEMVLSQVQPGTQPPPPATAPTPPVKPPPPAPQRSEIALQLDGGRLAGQDVDAASPHIVVSPGARIEGTIRIKVRNDMGANAIAPLAGTATWGEPERSLWQVNPWVKTGVSSHAAPVSLNAPQVPGTYYIVFALAGTYNIAQIMSGTHPGWQADWAKGNKVARQNPDVFRTAMAQGWVPFDWYSPEGPKHGKMAMCAIEVVVKR